MMRMEYRFMVKMGEIQHGGYGGMWIYVYINSCIQTYGVDGWGVK